MEGKKSIIEGREPKIDLENLRRKIADIAHQELDKKNRGKKYNPHLFEGFNAEELTEEDLDIYRGFLEHSLTPEQFRNYKGGLSMGKGVNNLEVDTRYNFALFLSNQLNYWENMRWFQPEVYSETMELLWQRYQGLRDKYKKLRDSFSENRQARKEFDDFKFGLEARKGIKETGNCIAFHAVVGSALERNDMAGRFFDFEGEDSIESYVDKMLEQLGGKNKEIKE